MQQPSQRPRPAALPTPTAHVEPPARVASPFAATHARSDSSDTFVQPATPDAAAHHHNSLAAGATSGGDSDEDNDDANTSWREHATVPKAVPGAVVGTPENQAQAAPDAIPLEASNLSSPPSHPVAAPTTNAVPTTTDRQPVLTVPAPETSTSGQGCESSPTASVTQAVSSSVGHSVPAQYQHQLPASLMMPSMGYPLQGFGMPMPMQSLSNKDVYPYGGVMVPMIPPMMLPPPQQQQHQNRGGRGGRGNGSANSPGAIPLLNH